MFLRELRSNCSDALERERYQELIGKSKMIQDLQISLITNEKKRIITIYDTGVGMTQEELIENLGTIAHSGSQEFSKVLETSETASPDSIIGQFGVGFYSTFIVADTVEVISKSDESEFAYHWVSDGTVREVY